MSMLLLNSRRGLAVARAISLGCRIMSSTPKAATTVESSLSATQQEQHATAAVYFDHDGGNDDFVALCYLLKHEHRFDLLGVSVTPANSWEGAGTRATRKILRTFSNKHCSSSPFSSSSTQGKIPVAESTLRGVNAFPDESSGSADSLSLRPGGRSPWCVLPRRSGADLCGNNRSISGGLVEGQRGRRLNCLLRAFPHLREPLENGVQDPRVHCRRTAG